MRKDTTVVKLDESERAVLAEYVALIETDGDIGIRLACKRLQSLIETLCNLQRSINSYLDSSANLCLMVARCKAIVSIDPETGEETESSIAQNIERGDDEETDE